MKLSKPKTKSFLVGVQQTVRLPHREHDDTIERTFTVEAKTARQAEEAVKNTGIKGQIMTAVQEKHKYMEAETLKDAEERPTGSEPRGKKEKQMKKPGATKKKLYILQNRIGADNKTVEAEFVPVDGELFTVPGHEKYKFFWNRTPDRTNDWTISSYETGMAVRRNISKKEKPGAIASLKRYLDTTKEYDNHIESNQLRYGLPPQMGGSTETKKWVNPTKDLDWSESKEKLQAVISKLKPYYGEKVIVSGGGGPGEQFATLRSVEIVPTILKGKDGFTLRAHFDDKTPFGGDEKWEPYLGSWQISIPEKSEKKSTDEETITEVWQETYAERKKDLTEVLKGSDIDPGDFMIGWHTMVAMAIREGKPVPQDVLDSFYPVDTLMKKHGIMFSGKQLEAEKKRYAKKKFDDQYRESMTFHRPKSEVLKEAEMQLSKPTPEVVNADIARLFKGDNKSRLQSLESSRSPLSQSSDERQSNAITISPDDPKVKIWEKNPGSMDVQGIDTPKSGAKRKSAKSARNRTSKRAPKSSPPSMGSIRG